MDQGPWDIVWRWKEHSEKLLNAIDMPSVEEAELVRYFTDLSGGGQ